MKDALRQHAKGITLAARVREVLRAAGEDVSILDAPSVNIPEYEPDAGVIAGGLCDTPEAQQQFDAKQKGSAP